MAMVLPFAYDGWKSFPSLYFGSNPSGLQNETQLALLARFSLVGWGWEQGTGPLCHNSWSHQVCPGKVH